MSDPIRVGCMACGWRGKRRLGDCSCYDEWAMYCSCVWGTCPKCKSKVQTMSYVQACREAVKAFDAAAHAELMRNAEPTANNCKPTRFTPEH